MVNNGVGQYIGGDYMAPAGMTEYMRRLTLFNTVSNRIRYGVEKTIPIKDLIAEAKELEKFLLGSK